MSTVFEASYTELKKLEEENARLQELLRGVGANRYWEGRWRDADAEIARLRAALSRICGIALAREDGLSANKVHKICVEMLNGDEQA